MLESQTFVYTALVVCLRKIKLQSFFVLNGCKALLLMLLNYQPLFCDMSPRSPNPLSSRGGAKAGHERAAEIETVVHGVSDVPC